GGGHVFVLPLVLMGNDKSVQARGLQGFSQLWQVLTAKRRAAGIVIVLEHAHPLGAVHLRFSRLSLGVLPWSLRGRSPQFRPRPRRNDGSDAEIGGSAGGLGGPGRRGGGGAGAEPLRPRTGDAAGAR